MFPWNSFPFSKEIQSKMQHMKPEEINQYVQNIMGKMFQSSPSSEVNPQDILKDFSGFHPFHQTQDNVSTPNHDNKLNYSVFETHDHIFVRIQMETEDWLRQLKLTHTSHLLILEHIPEIGDKHSIPLPSLVQKKGTTAKFKDKILEVKITKNIDIQYSEIDITEIL
ncbi:Hsp20/alpha crystallin family protein [Bacillus sp. V3B]|uniref:Hsp20/alpha crystallin family protein n=1 Tax=Bacillus sp. V3B TaxID=2804915 RepID=UPI00210EE3B3|nr:Hsp20/alpha crystallin family protein [Bacillus sp. V3B]MCQ6276608.1 Hsp20/alpha crystallin family protein [Bacillus sp. V3B]